MKSIETVVKVNPHRFIRFVPVTKTALLTGKVAEGPNTMVGREMLLAFDVDDLPKLWELVQLLEKHKGE